MKLQLKFLDCFAKSNNVFHTFTNEDNSETFDFYIIKGSIPFAKKFH
jgi:hypothetical protein